jgi:hypothetical protein
MTGIADGYRLYYDEASDSIKWIGSAGAVGDADSLGGVPASSYVVWGDTTETGGVGIATKHDLDLIPAVTDGDKGDITISGSGTVYTIDSMAVSLGKIQHVGTMSILGRYTAGTGTLQQIHLGNKFTISTDTVNVDFTGYWTSAQAAGAISDSIRHLPDSADVNNLISDSLAAVWDSTQTKSAIGDTATVLRDYVDSH